MFDGTKGLLPAGHLTERSTRPMVLAAEALLALGLALLSSGCGGIGGPTDATQATLAVFPDEDFLIAGIEGGPFFPETKTYLVSNSGDEPLQWSARTTHASVGITPASGVLDGGESVIVTAFADVVPGVPPGRYVAHMIFTNETIGGDGLEHTAALTVSAPSALEVSPSVGFSSSGLVGGPFDPLSAGYSLSNSGSSAIDWSIDSSEAWLSASLAAGQLQPDGLQSVTLSIDPEQAAQLAAATHVASVLFHDLTNATDFEVLVSLEVIEPAMLAATPATGFSTVGPPSGPFSPPSKSYTLSNSGSQLLVWQATKNTNIVTLSRTSGNLAPGQQTTVTVEINSSATSTLADGDYSDTVRFTNTTNGLGTSTRPVDLTLISPPPLLSITPGQPFASSGPVGGPFQPASKTYTLANGGGVTLNWQATASAAWMALSAASGSLAPGASTQVVVSINQAVAPWMAVGQYAGQLTFTNLTNGAGTTSLDASLHILPSGGGAPVLTPGPGFAGSTPEPGQIGSGTAKAIARWDVVPYQSIVAQTTPTFTVGVVAFHIAGIARVSFSLEGGPFVDSTSMMLNPETDVWEYCATIDATNFSTDRPIELRAIAYPNAAAPQAEGTGNYPGGGYPRLLDSLYLYVDSGTAAPTIAKYCRPSGSDSSGDGSQGNPYASPWRAAQAVDSAGGGSADGGIVYMGAGDYDWGQPGGGPIPTTRDRWLTFRPAPGVTRDQVHIVGGGYPGMAIDRVRLRELTLSHYVHGDDGGGGGSDSIWLDHVTCNGAGIGTSTHFSGWNPGFSRGRYWTDVFVSDDASSVPGGVDLARNITANRVRYGPAQPKLVINSSWDTVNNGGTSSHPDFIHWNYLGSGTTIDNAIVYGVTATNIDALGIFYKDTGHLQNVALVNLGLQLIGSGGCPIGENCLTLDHFLILNVTSTGPGLRWEMRRSSMTNMSIRGCHFSGMVINTQTGGDSVDGTWFDQNNYLPTAIMPGTHVTIGDPQFVNAFTPGPASPLRNRMTPIVPVDKDGNPRRSPATVGSVE